MADILSQLLIALTALSSLLSPNLGAINDCKADVTKSVSERIKVCPISGKDKSNFKAEEIVKHNLKGTFNRGDLTIEITDYRTMEGGIEVFARAWKNGRQLGFGKDGSVDIERFRIFNPPVMVSDPNGDILQTWEEKQIDGTKITKQRRLREDAREAIKEDLFHTIRLVGKENSEITLGKIGNTTSTFYPDASVESTSVDGYIGYGGGGLSWATVRGAATGNDADDSSATFRVSSDHGGSGEPYIYRGFTLFDTSAIPDSDSISSAIYSLYASSINDNQNDAQSYVTMIATNPASNTALTTADFDTVTYTKQSDTDADLTGISTSAYTDFALNATGLGNVSKVGISKFGLVNGHDYENIDLAAGANKLNIFTSYAADQTGSTNDPKLVVVHAAAAVEVKKQGIIWFYED